MISYQSTALEEHLLRKFAQHDDEKLMLIEFNRLREKIKQP